MSNYPAGFVDRLTIRGVPITQLHPGDVFWVNNSSVLVPKGVGGSDSNPGTYHRPFSTIDKAINVCKASRGDIVVVMPGHAETIASATALVPDVAGVAIIGLGSGSLRPTLTLSATSSSIIVSGANTVLQNFLVTISEDVTIVVEVTGAGSQIVNCEFRGAITPAKEWVNCIDIGGAAANACDRTVVSGCKFTSPAVGSTDAIKLSEISEGVIIENCSVFGDFSVAPIHNPTGFVCTNLTVRDCTLKNTQTGDLALELVSACTGALIRNFYSTDVAGIGGVDTGSCNSFECFACDAVDVSGALAPTITT